MEAAGNEDSNTICDEGSLALPSELADDIGVVEAIELIEFIERIEFIELDGICFNLTLTLKTFV